MADLTPRASDADRDRYADLLREHTTQGRLSVDQFSTRVDAVFTATTLPELDRLVADLPIAASGPQHRPAERAAGGSALRSFVCTVPPHCILLALVVVLAVLL